MNLFSSVRGLFVIIICCQSLCMQYMALAFKLAPQTCPTTTNACNQRHNRDVWSQLASSSQDFFTSARENNNAKAEAIKYAQASNPYALSVVLVRPVLDQNVGAVARAMLNFGLHDLRLVGPRCDHLGEEAMARASGAAGVLQAARVFPTIEEAVKDLHRVFATTARQRDLAQVIVTPRAAAGAAERCRARGQRCGFLFGTEASGLSNEELGLADTLVHIPTNPFFSSLNLAQAVNLIAHELHFGRLEAQSEGSSQEALTSRNDDSLANKDQISTFFHRLESELDIRGFQPQSKQRDAVYKNIRNIFLRANLSDREVATLHGVIKCLTREDDEQGTEAELLSIEQQQ
mmetsp:Transcript_16561/g.25070  ORF Transcript_16561/g.25070 Transcript_16561/m.25070 type:complete len:347 (-) Transcript_16561:165-1205(-)